MAGDRLIHLGSLRTAQGLATSFETGALGQTKNFGRLRTIGALLKNSPAEGLAAMIENYEWALAWGNTTLAQELELQIAEVIYDNAGDLNQILASVVQQRKPPKIFASAREVTAQLSMALGGGDHAPISRRKKPEMKTEASLSRTSPTQLPERQWPAEWRELKELADKSSPASLRNYFVYRLGLDHPLIARYLYTNWRFNAGNEKIIQAIYAEKLRAIILSATSDEAEILKNILTKYCEYADVAHELFHKGISHEVWHFFEMIVEKAPDPWLRYYVLKVALCLAIRDHEKYDSEELIRLGRLALKDKESLNALIGFRILEETDMELSRQLTPGDFGQGLKKKTGHHAFGTVVEKRAKGLMTKYILKRGRDRERGWASINDFQPTQSLPDLDPENSYPSPPFQKKYELLKNLAREYKDRSQFFSHFMSERVSVVVFPSGAKLALDDHYSVAVLKKGVEEGLIPKDYLEVIPAELVRYNLSLPEFLARHILTFGVDLSWDNVVPK